MEYCSKGGFIKGKEKVKGNSSVNDTVKIKGINGAPDIKASPGEVIVDKETLAKGPQAAIDFIANAVASNKDHYDDGGVVSSVWNAVKSAVDSPSVPSKPTGTSAGSDTGAKKLGQAWSAAGFANGGVVGGGSWDSLPPNPEELKASKASSWDSLPPNPEELKGKSKQDSSLGDKLQTGLENYGNATTLGYLPQLQAATQPLVDKAVGAITGTAPDPQSYVQRRDENIDRIAKESAENPKSALAGTALGVVNSALATPELPFLKGAGVVNSIGKGAATGATYGAVQNPGDVAGEVNPLQLQDRAKNAAIGTVVGGGTGLATSGISKGLNALSNSAKSAEEIAQEQAINASGGMKRDFKLLDEKGRLNEVGQFGLDNDIVQAGDNVESIAKKAETARKQAGDTLDTVYQTANQSLKPEDAEKIKGFNPVRDKDEILSSIKGKLAKDPDQKGALNAVSGYLDQLGEHYGDQTLTPGEANSIKTLADSKINYNRKSALPDPATEKGYSELRGYISDAVNQHVKDVGEATGNPEIAKMLADSNKQYGYASTLQNMAEDRLAQLRANHRFGLIDTISGIGGATTGAIAGEELGGHPVEGAGLGLLMGLVSKGARTYGPAIISSAANKAAPILEKTVEPAAQALQRIPESLVRQSATQYFTQHPPNQSRMKLSDLKGAK